jgi:hypothetical protein
MPKHRALRLLPDGEVALVERGMSPAQGLMSWDCGRAGKQSPCRALHAQQASPFATVTPDRCEGARTPCSVLGRMF